jgi:hypothetical protein
MDGNHDRRREGRNGGAPREERIERRFERGEVGEARTGWPERRGYPEDQGRYFGERDQGGYEDRDRWRASDTPSSGNYGRGEWGSGYRPESRPGWGQPSYSREREEEWYRARPPAGSQYGYRGGPNEREQWPAPQDWGGREEPWGSPRRNEWERDREQRARDVDRGLWNTQRLERRGRPPRNYRRSDERIRDEVCELIARQTDVDASDVDIEVVAGVVTLTGAVEDRAAKRELEDVAERVFGVSDIHNTLKVRKSFFNQLGERLFGPTEQTERKPGTTPGNSTTTTKM